MIYCWFHLHFYPFVLNFNFWRSIPFSAEDIDMAIPAINTDDVELPALLCEYPCAQFLVLRE